MTEIVVTIGALLFALLHMIHVSMSARRSTAAVLAIMGEDRAQAKEALDASMKRERELLSALLDSRAIQASQVKVGRYRKLPTGEPQPVNGRVLVEEPE